MTVPENCSVTTTINVYPYECHQDYRTTDSKLLITAPAAGDFFVKISDQNGTDGPRAIYRLNIQEAAA